MAANTAPPAREDDLVLAKQFAEDRLWRCGKSQAGILKNEKLIAEDAANSTTALSGAKSASE